MRLRRCERWGLLLRMGARLVDLVTTLCDLYFEEAYLRGYRLTLQAYSGFK